MPRKPNTNSEHYNDPFPSRLRDEFLQTANDTKALAEYLGCSVQAIGQFKDGTAKPKMENLIKIAHYFNCSLDYLLGLSDAKSLDTNIQSVCSLTGLSEQSVMLLMQKRERNKDIDKIIQALCEEVE